MIGVRSGEMGGCYNAIERSARGHGILKRLNEEHIPSSDKMIDDINNMLDYYDDGAIIEKMRKEYGDN